MTSKVKLEEDYRYPPNMCVYIYIYDFKNLIKIISFQVKRQKPPSLFEFVYGVDTAYIYIYMMV